MATAEVTPNPVPMGEVFKVEGTGFDVDNPVLLFVDGDEVARGWAHPTPDGGVADFFTSLDAPGSYEIDVSQPAGKASASVDLEVVTGWEIGEEEEASPARTTKRATKKTES